MAPPSPDNSVLLVAEHALVREGLRSLLSETPGLSVVAEAPTLAAAVPEAVTWQPDIVLLDVAPADETRELQRIREAVPHACMVCLGDTERAGELPLRCLPRDAGVAALCETLGALLGSRCAVCPMRDTCSVAIPAAALSPREKQVAVHVSAGLSSKQIAALLGIRLRTVNTYRESLARKLGASSPALLTRYVLHHGLDAEVNGARPQNDRRQPMMAPPRAAVR